MMVEAQVMPTAKPCFKMGKNMKILNDQYSNYGNNPSHSITLNHTKCKMKSLSKKPNMATNPMYIIKERIAKLID